jgi:uncharacterized membrane protein YbhN (UPF0104 family)
MTEAEAPLRPDAELERDIVVPRPSRLRTVAGLLISVAALAGCVLWALEQDAPEFPRGAGDWALLLLATALTGATAAARGWRWDEILRFAGIGHRRADAYGLTAVGYMGNNVLPARGGELLRIFLLAERADARRRNVLGTVLTERALDAGTLVGLFALLTLLDVGGSPAGRAPAIAAAGGLVLVLIAMVVYLRLRIAGRFQGFADRVRIVVAPLRLLLSRGGVELAALTIAVWAIESVIFWLVAHSLTSASGCWSPAWSSCSRRSSRSCPRRPATSGRSTRRSCSRCRRSTSRPAPRWAPRSPTAS